MKIETKNILVVGGGGFIGSHVVAELLKMPVGRVVVYDNFIRGEKKYLEKSLEDPRCSIYPKGGDIRDTDLLYDAMCGMDGVIHLAAMWLLHCSDYPRTAFHTNIEGTFNVLEMCVKAGIERLVYSSSASVYGDAVEVPMTETHPFNNRNFYGATKIAGEAMCRAFNDRYGLDYVGLRYMNVYGPHQDQNGAYSGVIPLMLNNIDENQSPVVNGNGSQAYDFIYVKDIARCNILALLASSTDEFYNVGTGIQTTIDELCNAILRIKESSIKVHYKPYNKDDARQLVKNRIGSTEKAESDLGFIYEYDLERGLKELINWRDNNGN